LTPPARTFTLEALPDEPPQHLAAVVAEGRRLVGVNVERVRPDLEVLGRGESWKTTISYTAMTHSWCLQAPLSDHENWLKVDDNVLMMRSGSAQ